MIKCNVINPLYQTLYTVILTTNSQMKTGQTKVYANGNALTGYLSIPSKIMTDSTMPFRFRDTITIAIITEKVTLDGKNHPFVILSPKVNPNE